MESEVSEVERLVATLYGRGTLLQAGVVHVTSAVRGADGRMHVIKIGEQAPRSATDFFVLNLCRARADVILTTAAVLRAEPALSHALQGAHARGLAGYRREVLRKASAPACAILTRSGDLPLDHPVWSDGTAKLVLTADSECARLRAALGTRAQVVGFDALDARLACGHLRAEGYGLVSVEAGPSATAVLYAAPSLVDELLLSTYEGPLAEASVGPALPDDGALLGGRVRTASTRCDEESSAWTFARWSREQARD